MDTICRAKTAHLHPSLKTKKRRLPESTRENEDSRKIGKYQPSNCSNSAIHTTSRWGNLVKSVIGNKL